MPKYEIDVKTTYDGSGTDQAAQGMNKLGQAHENAAHESEKATLSHKQLHKIIHALNGVIPGMGYLLQATFSPIGATIAIAVGALHAFKEKMKEFDEECKKAAEEAAKPLTGRLMAQRESVVELAKNLDELDYKLKKAALGESGLKAETERAIEAAKKQVSQSQTLGEALKESELVWLEAMHKAGLISEENYAKGRLQIELAFRQAKRRIEEEEIQLDIALKQKELKQAEADRPILRQAARDATKDEVRAKEDLRSFKVTKDRAADELSTSEKQLKDIEEKHSKYMPIFQDIVKRHGLGAEEPQMYESFWQAGEIPTTGKMEAFKEYAEAKTRADRAKGLWDRLPGEETRLTRAQDEATRQAQDLERAAAENASIISHERIGIGQRQIDLKVTQGANAALGALDVTNAKLQTVSSTPAGQAALGGVDAAIATAEALEKHRQVSDQSKQQLVNIASTVAGHAVNLQTAVAMMDRAAKNMGIFTSFAERLANTMQRLTTLESQLKNGMTFR